MARQNLAKEAAEQFKQELATESSMAAEGTGTTVPSAETTIVPPVQTTAIPPTQTAQPTNLPFTTGSSLFAEPPKVDPALERELADTKAELARFKAEEEARIAKQSALEEELSGLRAAAQAQEMAKLLDVEIGEFNTMAPEAVTELQNKLIKPALSRVVETMTSREAALEARLAEERAARQRSEMESIEARKRETQMQVDNKILAAHPDLIQIKDSHAFMEYMQRPVDGSSYTQGDLLGSEYRQGNAAYVIDVISRFKAGRPSLGSVASVPTVTTASQPMEGAEDIPAYTLEDVTTWKHELQTGKINREEFAERMGEYRKAQQS